MPRAKPLFSNSAQAARFAMPRNPMTARDADVAFALEEVACVVGVMALDHVHADEMFDYVVELDPFTHRSAAAVHYALLRAVGREVARRVEVRALKGPHAGWVAARTRRVVLTDATRAEAKARASTTSENEEFAEVVAVVAQAVPKPKLRAVILTADPEIPTVAELSLRDADVGMWSEFVGAAILEFRTARGPIDVVVADASFAREIDASLLGSIDRIVLGRPNGGVGAGRYVVLENPQGYEQLRRLLRWFPRVGRRRGAAGGALRSS